MNADVQLKYHLFARPSFWAGWAQIMDFDNTLFLYNNSLTPEQADYLALLNDWRIVGDDLRKAVKALESERQLQLELQI